MDDKARVEIEAAVFRDLLNHLDERSDVQNIDLMNLAGFGRNCLAKQYVAAPTDKGIELDLEQGRGTVYRMPCAEWNRKYQRKANPDQIASFKSSQKPTGATHA